MRLDLRVGSPGDNVHAEGAGFGSKETLDLGLDNPEAGGVAPARTPESSSSPAPPSTPGRVVTLSEGLAVDLDSGSVDQAFMMSGADISIGPGIDGSELDVGDGAAIYVVDGTPSRPDDCYAGYSTQSVQLPLQSNLCVLTDQGNLAFLVVTATSATTLTFRYHL